jgi:energy-coupling factor transporter transmembrane protein EcfT
MGVLRFLLSIATFILTMIIALFAFSYTLIYYPSTMRELQRAALHFREQLHELALPDNYMVWMDVFFQENQIVLVGFSIATRILIGLVLGILGLLFWRKRPSGSGAPAASSSPFSRWG